MVAFPFVVLALLVARAWNGPEIPDLTAPDMTVTTMPPTSIVDYSGVGLPRVPGETTTTLLQTGGARLMGVVTGPDGPVAGATVRLERLVGTAEARVDVVTGPDGRYDVPNLPGGRFRVRGFFAPTLAQTRPVVKFLQDGREHTIDLTVERFVGVTVLAASAPDPPLLGERFNLVVQVGNLSVDAEGVVRSVPLTGVRVQLAGSPTASLISQALGTTDRRGEVRYQFECNEIGANELQAIVELPLPPATTTTTVGGAPPTSGGIPTTTAPSNPVQPFDLKVPDCVNPPPTTTTTTTEPPASSSTSSSSSSTSSTSTTG